MLIEFSVQNFLSFKELTTISFVATNIKEHSETNVIDNNIRVLKSTAIYGGNGSGKSNLFKAITFMSKFIRNSSKNFQAEERIPVRPFVLGSDTGREPSSFEIIFISEGQKYRYGFQLNKERIISEWLFEENAKNKKENKLFLRELDEIKIERDFKEGKQLESKTRSNSLFLSVVAQFNGKIATRIMKYFSKKFNVISGLNNQYTGLTTELLNEDTNFRNQFNQLINVADLGIENVEVSEKDVDLSDFPEDLREFILDKIDEDISNLKSIDIYMLHRKYDEDKKFIGFEKFNMEEFESEGTKKLFSMLGPILDTLNSGNVLVIDELDSSMHPILTKFLVELFHSNRTNPNNAQLIFNTHDSNLLSNQIFRRDQIWFCEKDRYGVSHIYSLVDYSYNNKNIRKDEVYEKNYLNGKYGAIPYLGQFDFYCEEHTDGI